MEYLWNLNLCEWTKTSRKACSFAGGIGGGTDCLTALQNIIGAV